MDGLIAKHKIKLADPLIINFISPVNVGSMPTAAGGFVIYPNKSNTSTL